MEVQLITLNKGKKKMKAIFYKDGKKVKTVPFGQAGASDYTQHGEDKRKDNYLIRHKARENWNDPMTAGALSRWILWNKKTLKASILDYLKRFKLKLKK